LIWSAQVAASDMSNEELLRRIPSTILEFCLVRHFSAIYATVLWPTSPQQNAEGARDRKVTAGVKKRMLNRGWGNWESNGKAEGSSNIRLSPPVAQL
jgi:hypothetical protein